MITTQKGTHPIHYKYIDGQVKADSESRRISGYLAVFGNKDSAGDILIKGCFAKSIQERGPESSSYRKIAFLWQHDIKNPVGRLVVLKEDDYGLYFEAIIDKIPEGDRLLEQLKSGTINQFSIGFQYVWDKIEYDSETDAFIVKEVNLYEGSAVTIAANELTRFTGMKSEQLDSERNQLLRDTERCLKTLPFESQIEIRQLISKHISLAREQPGKPLTTNEPKPEKTYKFLTENLKLS